MNESQMKSLISSLEKKTDIQDKIIKNQEDQISALTKINSELKADNKRLTDEIEETKKFASDLLASYDEAVTLCKEQQAVLNKIQTSD